MWPLPTGEAKPVSRAHATLRGRRGRDSRIKKRKSFLKNGLVLALHRRYTEVPRRRTSENGAKGPLFDALWADTEGSLRVGLDLQVHWPTEVVNGPCSHPMGLRPSADRRLREVFRSLESEWRAANPFCHAFRQHLKRFDRSSSIAFRAGAEGKGRG